MKTDSTGNSTKIEDKNSLLASLPSNYTDVLKSLSEDQKDMKTQQRLALKDSYEIMHGKFNNRKLDSDKLTIPNIHHPSSFNIAMGQSSNPFILPKGENSKFELSESEQSLKHEGVAHDEGVRNSVPASQEMFKAPSISPPDGSNRSSTSSGILLIIVILNK